jgi:hypothetical protein
LSGRGASWSPSTTDEVRELAAYKTAMKEWRMGEAITKQQIASMIPDSLFIQVKNLGTAQEIFTYLSNLFEKRSRVVSVELLQKLQDQKCSEKGNIREHFDKLQTIREQLSSLGHAPTDESFTAIIMSSLPASYDPHLSALTASAKVSSIQLTTDILMSTVEQPRQRRGAHQTTMQPTTRMLANGLVESKGTATTVESMATCSETAEAQEEVLQGANQGRSPLEKGRTENLRLPQRQRTMRKMMNLKVSG